MPQIHKNRFLLAGWVLLALAGSSLARPDAYFDSTAVDLVQFLPPVPGTDSTRKELVEMHHLQDARTPRQVAYAQADQKISVFRFADVLDSAKFREDRLPVTAKFFSKVLATGNGVSNVAKRKFDRPRPYAADSTLRPCLDHPTNASYPSGHSLGGNLIAIVLADALADTSLKGRIYDRGWTFAKNRVLGGVHYPSDILAGRIAANLIAQRLYQEPEFRKDLEAVRAELKAEFGTKR
jgi:acid phosphatase (class A)